MITNVEKYAERHRKFMLAVDAEFLEQRRINPKFTVEKAITGLALRVKLAILRRDPRAGLLAAQAAHLALNGASRRREKGRLRKTALFDCHALPRLERRQQ